MLVDTKEGVRDLSSNPAHMTDSEGTILPSSFLPFCAYQTRVLGEDRADLPITPCSLAIPTILDGQLCFSLNVTNLSNTTSAFGQENSLLLLVDLGTTMSTTKHKSLPKLKQAKYFDTSVSEEEKTSARIYVQTLSETSNFGAGNFELTALKLMVGTSSFMEIPDGIKECRKGNLEECHTASFFARLQEKCQCIPWNLRYLYHLSSEVILQIMSSKLPTKGPLLHAGAGGLC